MSWDITKNHPHQQKIIHKPKQLAGKCKTKHLSFITTCYRKYKILQTKSLLMQAESKDMNHNIIVGTTLVSSGVRLFWFEGFECV